MGNFTVFGINGIPTDPCISGDNVAFFGTGANGQQGIYRAASSGPPTKVADLNTAIPGGTGNFTGFASAAYPPTPIISGDTVAFIGTGSGGQQGVYRAVPDGQQIKVADLNTAIPSATGNFTTFKSVALDPANAANIAIIGSGATVSGIYVSSNGGALQRVVDTTMTLPASTATFTNFKSVAIDPTDVAFLATASSGHDGIFAEVRGSLFDLAEVNNVIGGKTISSLDLGPLAFSQSAGFPTVAYQATFSDGSSSLLIATLPPVPGDFNRDGALNSADINSMLAALADLNAYKTAHGLSDADLLNIGDLDGDGR